MNQGSELPIKRILPESDNSRGSGLWLQLRIVAGWSGVVAGIAIMIYGHWLWDSSLEPKFDAQGYWYIGGGASLVIGSFVHVLFNNRRLRTVRRLENDSTSQRANMLTESSPHAPLDPPGNPYSPPKRL